MPQNQNIRQFRQHSPQLGEGVFVDLSAVVTGKVILGEHASVWPCVSIRGDLEPITIGLELIFKMDLFCIPHIIVLLMTGSMP